MTISFILIYERQKRGKPTRWQSVFFFSEKKIKKVFDWIFIKGNIYIIADTIASLRKEHLHM